MRRVYVTSGTIKSARYDKDKSALEIQFAGGDVYRYFNVEKDIYDGLMDSESKGKYFNEVIVKANYKFEKRES